MPRGRARPGAGRPPGSHGETAKIIQQAAGDGGLPLKVMLDNLRLYTKRADRLIARIAGGEVGLEPIEALKQVLAIRKRAEEVAAMAAPYCHPRQGNATEEKLDDGFVPLAERIAAYQRRDEIEASAGKVVQLPLDPPARF